MKLSRPTQNRDSGRVTVLLVALVAVASSSGLGMLGDRRTQAAAGVTAELRLSSPRVTAGSPVRGTLVLTNRGDAPVNLNQGCRPKWVVVLGRGRTPPGVAFSLECGPEPLVVAPGTTKRPFRVATGGRQPGSYRAFLVASQPSFPAAAPVKVRIVGRR